jgi:hypothetical protein
MTTILDAFVVEIGLDPKNFTKGQKEALDSFKKTQEEALKGGKAVEDQSKKTMEALGGIKAQALELFAVFAGGKSAVEFFGSIVKGDAAVGRLSRSTNLSADAISRWQGVARVFGGTAEGMAQSFTAVSDAVAGWKVGDVSPLIARFRELSTAGGTVIDVNKGVDQTFLTWPITSRPFTTRTRRRPASCRAAWASIPVLPISCSKARPPSSRCSTR